MKIELRMNPGKIASHSGCLLVIIVSALSLIQCTVKKPEAPSWDTQFVVPVVNRNYTMPELVDKMNQDGIGFDADSNVIYSLAHDIDTLRLDAQYLSTDDLLFAVTQRVGLIDLTPPAATPNSVALDSVPGLSAFLPGVIPPASFAFTNTLAPFGTYESISVTSGTMWVVIDNQLGLDLSVVSVTLRDVINARTIGSQTVPGGIPDGTVDSIAFDISGQTVSNVIEVDLAISTPGATILSTSNKQVTTVVRFDDPIAVSSAITEVPSFSRAFNQPVPLSETDAIYRASIATGQLSLDLTNQTNLPITMDITLPDISGSGTPLTIQQSLSANSAQSRVVDLSGYEFLPSDSTIPQTIVLEVMASTPGTGSTQIVVDEDDLISAAASLSGMSFASVTGVPAGISASVAPIQQSIEVPPGFDSLQLQNTVLTLEIESTVDLPGLIDLQLNGNNGKSLTLAGVVAAGTQAFPVVTTLIDSNVADFLTPVPSLIDISPTGSFGDGFTEGTIAMGDYVTGRVRIVSPMEAIIGEVTIDADVNSEEIDQLHVQDVLDNVIEARLVYNVVNHLPLGVQVSIALDGDSLLVSSNPALTIDNISIGAAPTVAGIVSDPTATGYQSIILTREDIQILTNQILYIASRLTLNDSNGLPVKLTVDDYVTVTGRIEIDYHFDGSL